MGLANLRPIVAALIDGGREPATPAAVVQEGTTPYQRVVRAPLDGIAQAAEDADIRSPAIIVVGEVASVLPDEVLGTGVPAGDLGPSASVG
jgi:siroheme synthase